MVENLNMVFSRLKEANLKLNPKKCIFFQKNVKYLGHIISKEGVTTDPEKIIADLEGQLARWLERLQEFEFEIIHRKGQSHGNADGLSRRLSEAFGCEYCAKVEKKSAEETQKMVTRIVLASENFEEWLPQDRIKEILKETHDSPFGGHFGVNKTLEKIRKRFFWANCKQDVEKWCRTCKICVSKKGPLGKGKSPLQIYNVEAPLERVQMDILGPLPLTKLGNKYLLVMVDCFTKWVEAFPIKNIRAKTVAEVFVNQFVSRHGVPVEIHTDQGKNFESQLFAELMRLLGIKKTRTTALHPQSDGQVERQHQTIINYLAK
ncbi:integrase core domain protein, partial [Lasius niger]